MVQGVFVQNNIPIIKIAIAWGQAIQTPFFILDTGFSGDLQVTPQIAKDLGLQVTGVTNTRIANGQTVAVPTAQAIASMEGAVSFVQILISESMPLAGISFLAKFDYKAIVDCKYKTVVLERVV
jgi:predicted aspartyl protease